MVVPWLRLLMAGLTLRRPGFGSSSVHGRFVMDMVALEEVFLLFGFLLFVSFHQLSSSSPRCSYQKDEWAMPGNLQQNNAVSGIGEYWVKKTLSPFFSVCEGIKCRGIWKYCIIENPLAVIEGGAISGFDCVYK
jgi:hypothetical protein